MVFFLTNQIDQPLKTIWTEVETNLSRRTVRPHVGDQKSRRTAPANKEVLQKGGTWSFELPVDIQKLMLYIDKVKRCLFKPRGGNRGKKNSE